MSSVYNLSCKTIEQQQEQVGDDDFVNSTFRKYCVPYTDTCILNNYYFK